MTKRVITKSRAITKGWGQVRNLADTLPALTGSSDNREHDEAHAPPPANSSLSQSPEAAGLDHFSIYGVAYISQRLLKPEQADAYSKEEKTGHPWLSLSRWGPGLEGSLLLQTRLLHRA